MAMIALICPQCHSQLEPTEQDMKRGYAECPSCGTVIQFNEVQKVEHSGKIELSNTKQAKNRIDLAHRAFSAGNYEEAYGYYTKVLEDIPDDILSLYRKGMCAIRLSMYENLRVPEFSANFSQARRLINKKIAGLSSETGEERREKENLRTLGQQVCEEVYSLLSKISSSPTLFAKRLDDTGQDERKVVVWTEIADLYLIAAECVPPDDYEELIQTVVSYVPETYEEKILTAGIAFCNKVLDHKTDKKGNKKYTFHNFKIDDAQELVFSDIQAKLEKKLKNLPTWIARRQHRIPEIEGKIKDWEEEIKRLPAKRAAAKENLDAAIEQFWENNPKLREQRKKVMHPKNFILTWSGAFVCFFLWVMIYGIFTEPEDAIYGCIGCLVIIFFPAKKLIKKIRAKKEEFSQSVYSPEIKALQEKLADLEKKCTDKDSELTKLKNELARLKIEDE